MKYPLHVIVDGVDRVGKSTVCNLLSTTLHMPITRMPLTERIIQSPLNMNGIGIEVAAQVYNLTLMSLKDCNFIVDRGFNTSRVYNEVFDRHMDLSYIDVVEKALNPSVFILYNKNIDLLLQRGEELLPAAKFKTVQDAYIRLAIEKGYYLLDVTGLLPEDVEHRIVARLIQETNDGQ